jgi:LysM repeat protein
MLLVVVALSATSCGSTALESTNATDVVATDYVTIAPPTTTVPPTTTEPPAPGTVITSESTYVIVDGDYPFVVANRFGVDFKAFVELNGWTVENGEVPEWPPVGTTIKIPAGAKVPGDPAIAATLNTSAPVVPETVVESIPTSIDGQTPPSSSVAEGEGCGTYTVLEGDYPSKVVEKLNTTLAKLDEANASTEGYDIFYVGLDIVIPC